MTLRSLFLAVLVIAGCNLPVEEDGSSLFSQATSSVTLEHGGLVEVRSLVLDRPGNCYNIGQKWSQAVLPGRSSIWSPEVRPSMQRPIYASDFVGYDRVLRTFDDNDEEGGHYTVTHALALRPSYAALPRCIPVLSIF
jgi:hypothetical protein